MQYLLLTAIRWFTQLLVFLLLARAILSWFARDPYSTLGRIYQVVIRLTEPIVEPCRKFMSRFNTGIFDFSVVIAMLLVQIVASVLMTIISLIF